MKRETIRVLDAGGHALVVGSASGTPIGLSIKGAGIAWAENVRDRGRIRAIVLRKH